MRALVHPAIRDVTLEAILRALADPVRFAIFADIANSSCSQNCSNFLHVSDRAIPKSTLSQHFRILREAGLIRGERSGVEMRNTSRCGEINERFPGLLAAIMQAHAKEQRCARARIPRSREETRNAEGAAKPSAASTAAKKGSKGRGRAGSPKKAR